MKLGKTLTELAVEIERQAKSKRDFIASTRNTLMVPHPDGNIAMDIGDKGQYPVNEIAHRQIAEHTGVPAKYYDRMRAEAPELLIRNINHWFRENPSTRLNRTLDGRVRAQLSDKYSTLDNYDFAQAVLPILGQRNLIVHSSEITERRLYIKAVDEQLFKDVPVGYKMGDGSHKIFDTCAPAAILSNSEVGFGRLVVETGIYTGGCTNLALFAAGGMRRTHVGARHIMTENLAVEDLDEVLSDQTKRKTMEALWLQVRDVLASAFDEAIVQKRLEKLAATAENMIPARNVEKVMEVVQERFTLTSDERGSVFEHLINGGSLSQYGLANAITRTAQDAADYDRATELEYLGGKVFELPRTDWEALAEAA
jgi:hypothetical protein